MTSNDLKDGLRYVTFEDELVEMPPSACNQCNVPWNFQTNGFDVSDFEPKWLNFKVKAEEFEQILAELRKSPYYAIPSSKKPVIVGSIAALLVVASALSSFWVMRSHGKLALFMFVAIIFLLATLIPVFVLVSKQIGNARRQRVEQLRKIIARLDEERFIHRDIKLDLSQYGSYLVVKITQEVNLVVTSSDLDEIADDESLSTNATTTAPSVQPNDTKAQDTISKVKPPKKAQIMKIKDKKKNADIAITATTKEVEQLLIKDSMARLENIDSLSTPVPQTDRTLSVRQINWGKLECRQALKTKHHAENI